MALAESFDVIVVGARCAGSPLAAMLARSGVKVVLVEQATFPRDTLSTHNFQADALVFLDRLGVTQHLRATGAPFIQRLDNRAEDVCFTTDWPQRPGDVGGIASVRRFILDPILAGAAEAAGAEVRMATKVIGLETEGGRVVGVRVTGRSGEAVLRARLVVGADGRNSTIAGLCEARKYNVVPNQRFVYWAFFEGADIGADPTFVFHRWADRFVIANPADSGLYLVVVVPDLAELDGFRADLEGRFLDHAQSCAPVARALTGARRVGRFLGMIRWVGFFRQASGPGWVLVGDAGHFKDPSVARGIGDAFLQADAVAPVIVSALGGSASQLDEAMCRWGRWRDRTFAEHYWFANDLGRAGRLPVVLPEIVRGLHERGKVAAAVDLFSHRRTPSQVLTPPRLLGATGRLLRRRDHDWRTVLREVGSLVAEDARRRLQNRRPVFATSRAAQADAGATEIEDIAVP